MIKCKCVLLKICYSYQEKKWYSTSKRKICELNKDFKNKKQKTKNQQHST